MKIEVGDYIRTRNNGIKKVYRINENANINKYWVKSNILDKDGDEFFVTIKVDEVIKHSKNLIDLIEVGDLVEIENEIMQVARIYKNGKMSRIETIDGNMHFLCEIKSILTKEQFDLNCFRLEE